MSALLKFLPNVTSNTSSKEAKGRAHWVEGKYPVAALEDIIQSKRIAAREKDKEVLHRLEAFAKYLKGKRPK